jgi:exodeoxyribonuclease VII small subunit
MAEKKKRTFEESMQRLEDIVSELEKNEKPMDETLALFQEGVELVKTCDSQLKKFEKQIDTIVKSSEDNDTD